MALITSTEPTYLEKLEKLMNLQPSKVEPKSFFTKLHWTVVGGGGGGVGVGAVIQTLR